MLENKEVWKDISGYKGYQISDKGRVWNAKTQRYLKPSVKDSGYYQVNLIANNGKRKKEYIHRLVALAFIENPNGFTEVHHIDGNRGNNSADNLEWINRNEHMKKYHGYKVYQYDNGELVGEYNSIQEAAESVGGTRSGLNSYFAIGHAFYKGYVWKKENYNI